jgi:hypothetical protein
MFWIDERAQASDTASREFERAGEFVELGDGQWTSMTLRLSRPRIAGGYSLSNEKCINMKLNSP